MPQYQRLTLRDLPLPAKLVLTVFLMSVGLGYLSAMIQLHLKHAGKGNPLPTVEDVVPRFSGKPWPLNAPPENPPPKVEAPKGNPLGKFAEGIPIKTLITNRCGKCHGDEGGEDPHLDSYEKLAKFFEPKPGAGKIHKLVTAPPDAAFDKDSSMRQAFTAKSMIGDEDWKKAFPILPPDKQQELLLEREAERLMLVAWLEAGAPKDVYDKDFFKAEKPPAPVVETRESRAKKRQMSVDSLTQSTHAHLLSFAMLWALTGFIFAFTSYRPWVRIALAPAVLIAQVADVLCWWLARLPDVGPYFAVAILGTGAIVGVGLTLQILLSMFNMYGYKGKMALAFICLFGAGGLGLAFIKVIEPELAAERNEIQAQP